MSFVAFILQHWGAPHIALYSFHIGCENIPNIYVIACQGENAVYRICIGLAIWFFVLSVITTCSKRTHTGYWGIKILVLLILCGGLFFLPIVGHPSYVNIARVISGIFLVSQIIAFIDVAYKWNAFFVDKAYDDYDGEDNRWLVAALVFCIAIMITTIGIIIFLYIEYNHCTRQLVFTTISTIAVIGTTCVQLLTHKTESSLLTSCIVALYAIYLCWVAVSSDECNPEEPTDQQMVIGCLVTTFSLAWTCFSVGTSDFGFVSDTESQEEDPEEQYQEEDEIDDQDDTQANIFHFIMATGSIYISMLLTKWGTGSGHYSNAQMWVSIISQWLSIIIYIWTLVSAKLCPSRFDEFHSI